MLRSYAAQLQRLRFLLRLKPFDEAQPEGRSNERYRRILISGIASALSKGVSILTLWVSIPLTIGYLGGERFGVWMTISSFGALLAFADMGLGNGLMNAVSDAYGRKNVDDIKKYISSAFIILGGLSVLLLFGFILLREFASLPDMLAVSDDQAREELDISLAIFAVCFALNIPLNIVQRVQMGLQTGYAASFWQMMGATAGLVALFIVMAIHGGLPWLIAAGFGTPLFVAVLNSVVFWGKTRPDLQPSLGEYRWAYARQLIRTGFLFFVLQASASVAYASDNIIIAHLLGQEVVAQYSVVSRLFEGLLMGIAVFMMPLWPAYAEAAASGEYGWIKKALAKSMGITLFILLLSVIILVLGSETITKLWVGDHVQYSRDLFIVYGIWAILKGIGNTFAMFLNGLNVVGYQVVVAILFSVCSIALKFHFSNENGVIGIPFSLILAYILFAIIPYAFLWRKIAMRKMIF